MSLNIKNPEANDLARELSIITGESMASAVTEAIRERLARLRSSREPDLTTRLLEIGRDCSLHIKPEYRFIDHGEMLYGEDGLPL